MNNALEKKKPLLGCFEISIFLKNGFNHFKSDKRSFLLSFIVPLFMLPLLVWSIPYVYEAKTELHALALPYVTVLFIAKELLILMLSIILIYIFCKFSKRLENFIITLTVLNWAALIGIVLFIPIALLLQYSNHTYDTLYPAMVVSSLYSYAIGLFILKHCLQIPWELSCFLIACSIAINEGCMDLLYTIASISH